MVHDTGAIIALGTNRSGILAGEEAKETRSKNLRAGRPVGKEVDFGRGKQETNRQMSQGIH